MCNSKLIRFGLLATTTALLSSCALPKGELFNFGSNSMKPNAPLQAGVRYEVRKALATTIPFHPNKVSGYTFVVNSPQPMLSKTVGRGSAMNVRTTAYTHNESDHIIYGVKSAVGTNLKYGSTRSAAADWSRYPVGTRFCIANEPGVVYEVDDYGSALVGTGTIDLYKPSRSMMNEWGVRHVDIQVVKWGSYERSMELMRERTRWPHVREMIRGIQSHVSPVGTTVRSIQKTASL